MINVLQIMIVGCAGKTTKESEQNYVVVETTGDFKVEETFDFTSVSHAVVGDVSNSNNKIQDGVYGVGILSDGCSIVWCSDQYSGVFVYVKEELNDASMIKYVAKMGEDTISYDDFKESMLN